MTTPPNINPAPLRILGRTVPAYNVKKLIVHSGNGQAALAGHNPRAYWITSHIPFLRAGDIIKIDGTIYKILSDPRQTPDGVWNIDEMECQDDY